MAIDPAAVAFDAAGLAAAIVVDRADGRVLMLGWMDAEAITATQATGEVHFHSRSRGRLWRKGETSGNTLGLVSMELDCDRDAILVVADPNGPTCHTGARSCFDPVAGAPSGGGIAAGFGWLDVLWSTIEERARTRPTGSYTAHLLEGGVDATSRKVVEEAVEVVLAARDDAEAERAALGRMDTHAALAGEIADLVYHALVAAAERGVSGTDLITILRDRHRP